jgi:hypothetical protein
MAKKDSLESSRPAPVSLHPLTTEQALGALLRTPNPSPTKAIAARKPRRRKEKVGTK